MPPLRTPSRLSLESAVQRIAKATNRSLFELELFEAIHEALCQGDLVARGCAEDRDGNVGHDHEIPAAIWQVMTPQQFRDRYACPRVAFYGSASQLGDERYLTRVTLGPPEIDDWIQSVREQDSPPETHLPGKRNGPKITQAKNAILKHWAGQKPTGTIKEITNSIASLCEGRPPSDRTVKRALKDLNFR